MQVGYESRKLKKKIPRSRTSPAVHPQQRGKHKKNALAFRDSTAESKQASKRASSSSSAFVCTPGITKKPRRHVLFTTSLRAACLSIRVPSSSYFSGFGLFFTPRKFKFFSSKELTVFGSASLGCIGLFGWCMRNGSVGRVRDSRTEDSGFESPEQRDWKTFFKVPIEVPIEFRVYIQK